MNDRIYLIGPIDTDHVPTNGVTMKNQLFLKRFSELFSKVEYIDTWNINKKPWRIIEIFFALMFKKSYRFIISGGHSSRFIFKLLYKLKISRNVYFWVAGGSIAEAIKEGLYEIEELNNLCYVLVQGRSMQKELHQLGIKNALYVPNSKPIIFVPELSTYNPPSKIRFVFLSRIHPDKGCDEILECARRLNENGFEEKYEISFFGSLFETYKESFMNQLKELKNVKYEGFLNLTNVSGYCKLSSFDVMLFPSYWAGEGFPGVVIDAYIAGIPIIASDWNLNKEVVNDGKTGYIIKTKDVQLLYDAMLSFIKGEVNLKEMREYCAKYAYNYDYRNVISERFMNSIGFN